MEVERDVSFKAALQWQWTGQGGVPNTEGVGGVLNVGAARVPKALVPFVSSTVVDITVYLKGVTRLHEEAK
eukprot:CAMPEP_0113945902 /NCGR_PEP_ID=MMETSP1339-20121228/52854_1 /TAXON_ID=94617 /ORGANISM="Fibrocapsa japonica" /LENGTH=70 /DNA_ID=CAMNT_0000951737 /DNA_START=20 /DNA_END=229 /DNA_ORIENTATION=- /assembly_acc=CAM_ASM_000762